MKTVFMLVVMSACCAFGLDEYLERHPWEMNWEIADWGRVRGADRVGLATLVNFDPIKSNKEGVEVGLQFTDMLKGEGCELEITIPHSMRDPADMPTGWENLRQRDPTKPWKWEAGKAYGFLCTFDAEKKLWMVNWAVPQEQWNAFKENAQKQKMDFEAFIREKKMELKAIDQIWRDKYNNGEVSFEEAGEIRKANQGKRLDIKNQMSEEGEKYRILEFNWYNPDETWP